MKRVIVTGATSMIGLSLIEECIKNNVFVMALVRKSSKNLDRLPESDLLEICECDLNEMSNFIVSGQNGFDVFYHFAWSNTDKAGRLSPEKQYLNIQSGLEAVALASRLGCRKFVGSGSQAEYGIHIDKKTRPDSVLSPTTSYGIAKLAAGKLCSILAQQKEMDFFWVRVFSVFGRNDQPDTLVSSTIKKLLNREHCSFTDATHQWDYLYDEDAGRAFYLIGEKSIGNKFYCLGSGESRPLKEFIQILRNTISPGTELGFGELPTQGIISAMCADISDLSRDTGFVPKISFEVALRHMLK